MKVFITGATGLVGAHTTRELLRAGHTVRLLVRNRDKAERYFGALGVTIDDYVVADMRDAPAVREGLRGCDAVVHAAAVVAVEKSRAREIHESNLQALHAVLDGAIAAGIRNIIYVSSVGALCNDRRQVSTPVIDESAELFDQSTDAYRRSKTECEKCVRALQEQGAPIQITYPTAVLGPDDPGFNESNGALWRFLAQVVPQCSSGFQLVDARDIAVAHRLMLERGVPSDPTEARFIIGGHYYEWRRLGQALDEVMGKRLFKFWMPDPVWLAMGILLDVIKKIIPVDFPLTEEAAVFVTRWTPASSAKAEQQLGLRFRPGADTLRDTAVWMYRAGHLKGQPANPALQS